MFHVIDHDFLIKGIISFFSQSTDYFKDYLNLYISGNLNSYTPKGYYYCYKYAIFWNVIYNSDLLSIPNIQGDHHHLVVKIVTTTLRCLVVLPVRYNCHIYNDLYCQDMKQ